MNPAALTKTPRGAHLDCPRVEFEKWHALGNDYVIVETAALPFELTPARDARDLRAAHGRVRRRDPVAL